MKYKVGDKVRVRPDLKQGKYYGNEGENPEVYTTYDMAQLAGQVVTISEHPSSATRYRVEEDYGEWSWVDGMFAGLVVDAEPEPQPKPEGDPKFKVGDKVRVIPNPKPGTTYSMKGSSYHDNMVDEMRALAGKVVTIIEASKSGYSSKEDNWHWVDGMFSGLVTDTNPEPTPALHTDWSWEDLF